MSYNASTREKKHVHDEYHLGLEKVREKYGSVKSVINDLKKFVKNTQAVISNFDYNNPFAFYENVWLLRADAEFLVARITFGELSNEVKNISEKTLWKEAFYKGAKTPRNMKQLKHTLEQIEELITSTLQHIENNEWEKVYRNLWKAKELLSRALQRTIEKKNFQTSKIDLKQ